MPWHGRPAERRLMRVLVVGAGIAGMAAARALHQRGVDVDIIERASAHQSAGAGIFLPGNGVRALDGLGLGRELRERAAVVRRQRLMDDRGRVLVDFDAEAFWSEAAPPLALHRSVLHAILAAGSPASASGSKRRGVHGGGPRPRARRDEGRHRGSYDVASAPTGSSTTRRLLGLGAPRSLAVGWRSVVYDREGLTGWNAWLGRDRTFLGIAIGGSMTYVYADIRSNSATDPTCGDAGQLIELFRAFPEPVRQLAERIPHGNVQFSVIEEVGPVSWGRGRVVLIGDAAHGMSPNMAEGASLAIEDAAVLARSIADLASLSTALTDFRARRSPRVDWVRSRTHRRDRLRSLHPGIRSTILRFGGHRTFQAHYRPLLALP
jgi:2-polyprenyl-6-methoxyphenol hydroxylase-like FAD-dependent oxidoreductase